MKRKPIITLFLSSIIISGLVFVFSVNFSIAGNSTKNYVISGYVSDPSGKAVMGAYTYLVNITGSSFGSGFSTDYAGFYYMTAPAGTYTLVVRGLTGSHTCYSEKIL